MSFLRIASYCLALLFLLTNLSASAQTVFLDARKAIDMRKAVPSSQKFSGNAKATIDSYVEDKSHEMVLIIQINPKALDANTLTITISEGVSQTFEKIKVNDEFWPGMKVWHGRGGAKENPNFQDEAQFYMRNGSVSGSFWIGRRAFRIIQLSDGRVMLSESGEKIKNPQPHPEVKSTRHQISGSLLTPDFVGIMGEPSKPAVSLPAEFVLQLRNTMPALNMGVLPTYQELLAVDRTGAFGAKPMENYGVLQFAAPQPMAAIPFNPTTISPAGINLLFAVTPQALSLKGNSTAFISEVVGEMNQIMSDNNVSVRFNLVGVETFPDYGDAGIAYTRVSRHYELVRARNRTNADLIVVFGIFGSSCIGLAQAEERLPSAAEAYAIVNATCQQFARSTIHEIGHLMGGRHNVERDGRMLPYATGHGYIAKSHYFPSQNGFPAVECTQTIMADQPLAGGCGRSIWRSLWSNPSYKVGDLHKQQPPFNWWGPYQSVYLGNASTANMRGVLEATLPRTRSLRNEKLPESGFEAILMLVTGLFD